MDSVEEAVETKAARQVATAAHRVVVAARQTAEAQAFATPPLPPEPAPHAPREQQAAHTTEAGDAAPPREPPPAPSMHLLAFVDEVKHLTSACLAA